MPTSAITNPTLAQQFLDAIDALFGAASRLSACPRQRADGFGHIQTLTRGRRTNACSPREPAIYSRDCALLRRDGLAKHPGQRPSVHPQRDGHSLPPGRARAH
jgi:hypothetical protein